LVYDVTTDAQGRVSGTTLIGGSKLTPFVVVEKIEACIGSWQLAASVIERPSL